MTDKAQEILKQTADDVEVGLDEAKEKWQEKIAQLKEGLQREVSDDLIEQRAAQIVRNDLLNITQSRGFGGGDVEELPMLALGFDRRDGDYFVTDGDALVALAIVNPPEDPAGVAVILIDSDHGIDLEYAMEAFQPLNTLRAYVSRRQTGTRDNEPTIEKGGNVTYVCNTTTESKFGIVDPADVDDDDLLSDLPAEPEERWALVNEHFIDGDEEVSLQDYHEHVTETVPGRTRDYEAAFGVDVKRIEGLVVDTYANDDGFGTITVHDDTIMEEDDVNPELVADQQRTPGLQVMLDPELITFGEESLICAYGYIEQRDDTGQYLMRGLGVVPISSTEPDEPAETSTDDSSIEEETI